MTCDFLIRGSAVGPFHGFLAPGCAREKHEKMKERNANGLLSFLFRSILLVAYAPAEVISFAAWFPASTRSRSFEGTARQGSDLLTPGQKPAKLLKLLNP